MLDPPYIEIIGLAGSGKSTLRDLLIEQGRKEGYCYQHRQPLNLSFLGRFKIITKFLYFLFAP